MADDNMANKTASQLMHDISLRSAELIHEIATPLATSKVNAEFIARYWPQILECLRKDSNIEIPESHLDALEKAPAVLIEQITSVQQFSLKYWREVEDHLKHAGAHYTQLSQESLREGPPLTFLGVLDEIAHQDNILKLLTPYHQVHIATTTREALKKCSEQHYDVVLIATRLLDERIGTPALRQAMNKPSIIFGLASGASDHEYRTEDFDKVINELPDAEELAHCLQELYRYRDSQSK